VPGWNVQSGRLRDEPYAARQRVERGPGAGRFSTELPEQGLHVTRSTIVDDLEVREIGGHAGVLQGAQRQDEISLRELQGEEVLAELDVVVFHAAQRVAVGLPRALLISGPRPGRGGDLHDDGVARVIPSQHPF
jgi:hypothetical protein